MSEKDPQSAWLEAWTASQKDFWERMLRGQPGEAAPPPPGLAMFAQFFAPPAGGPAQDLTRKLAEFGEGYLGVAREFWKVAGQGSAGAADPGKLQGDLESLRAGLAQGFSRLYASGPLGDDLMAAWQRLGGIPAGAPGLPPAWPGMPALGPSRERQEALQRLGDAMSHYQQALGRYGELLARVSAEAVDRLARRVAQRAASKEPVGSFRAMYDLWVDSGEEAFAAAAHGAEFAKAQSDLNDALMELKSEQQRQVEDWARSLDLPTRKEMNSVLKRLNTLRRRVRELEEEVEQRKQGRHP